MKKKGKFVTIVIILIFCSIILYAFPTGITGVTRKSNNPGCICHSISPSMNVIVSITGPDVLTTNETAVYTLTITGGPLVRGGTNIAASDGVLDIITGEGLRKEGSELTHVSPKAPVNGTVSFQFNYTAPANTGDVTLFANGNSVNFNGNTVGDQWNFADNKIITVNEATGVDDDQIVNNYNLGQNYPNPFNPSTSIQYEVGNPVNGTGKQFVLLKVYDILGNEIATLVNEEQSPGIYRVQFNGKGTSNLSLPSGTYLYKLIAGDFVSTKKMLLIK